MTEPRAAEVSQAAEKIESEDVTVLCLKFFMGLSRSRRLPAGLLIVMVVITPGCSEPAPLTLRGDSVAASSSLQTALEAWQSGQSATDLQSGAPPMYVSDEDWRAGRLLESFQIEENPAENGSNWRVFAVLKLKSNGGPAVSERACYTVELNKAVSIVRSDFME